MEYEEISITLGAGARTSKSKTSGFKGGACKLALKDFSNLLGQVESTKNTAEYYESEACNLQEQLEG